MADLQGVFIKIIILFLLTRNSARGIHLTRNENELIGLVQIYRHGERSPLMYYENDPWKDILPRYIGNGQLTTRGKRMQFKLGQFTRQRYNEFLPREYDEGWFRAYSTDTDRTLMSCEANLAGLFWPKMDEIWNPFLPWQPIPIHTASNAILFQQSSQECPSYQAEKDKTFKEHSMFKVLNSSEFSDIYSYIKNHSGNDVVYGNSLLMLYNTLMTEDQLDLELPEWTRPVYPEPLQFLAESILKGQTYTDKMKRLVAGPWLNEVYNMFKNVSCNRTPDIQFQMYSAHDDDIAALLTILAPSDPLHWPSYGSTLYLELWNKKGIPTINVLHKDDDLGIFKMIDVPGCGYDCALKDFGKVMSKYLIDFETWEKECTADSGKPEFNIFSSWFGIKK